MAKAPWQSMLSSVEAVHLSWDAMSTTLWSATGFQMGVSSNGDPSTGAWVNDAEI